MSKTLIFLWTSIILDVAYAISATSFMWAHFQWLGVFYVIPVIGYALESVLDNVSQVFKNYGEK